MERQLSVSYVIPTLNSAKTLEACLAAILAQRVSRAEYEIVVADAGSTDETVKIARRMGVAAQDLEMLKQVAVLHDIGKLGIHDAVLNKPDKLNLEEPHLRLRTPLIVLKVVGRGHLNVNAVV